MTRNNVHGFELHRMATGVADLDAALEGGIPEGSTTVIAGASGTGKTALALQMAFHTARQGRKCIFFTTLSEPAPKLIRYMQLYRFFDAGLLEEGSLILADLGTKLREQGAEAALSQLIERVEAEEPDLVVVDSFKAIHHLLEPARERSFVYDLAVSMAGWGATTLLIGEYTEEEIATSPEFAIADGIIHLAAVRHELTLVRELEIRKLRGSDFRTGVHFYELDANGLTFYPRVRGPAQRDLPAPSLSERISTGITGLDRLLGGGLLPGSSTVLLGATGTGKTLLGLGFAVEGTRCGEPCIIFTLEETLAQLRSVAASVGWDLAPLEQNRLLELRYTSPVELSTDQFLHQAVRAVQRLGARRAVLDSLTTMALGTTSERRFKELVYALIKHFRAAGVTVLMSMEIPELLGTVRVTGYGVSFAADNLVYMRHVERNGRLSRAFAIIKARGTQHSNEICEMTISPGGIRIGEPLSELEGVLTGTPEWKT